MPSWDSVQYLQFEDARTRPAQDLLARVPLPAPNTVVDVGCGPGNSTRLLAERWPNASVIGLDASAEMLARAREVVAEATYVEADLRNWSPETPVDLVFSNATLQWVEDHPAALDHLLGWLAPGGALAVQMPDNFDQPSHVLMRHVASRDRWRLHLAGVLREAPVASAVDYYRMLSDGHRVDIWTIEYLHVLTGGDPVLDWVRGSGLRPVLDRLDERGGEEFVAEYAAALREAYQPEPDGTTLFPFRRLFFVVSG
jgi:trans-aconitate 2-methyltransferase